MPSDRDYAVRALNCRANDLSQTVLGVQGLSAGDTATPNALQPFFDGDAGDSAIPNRRPEADVGPARNYPKWIHAAPAGHGAFRISDPPTCENLQALERSAPELPEAWFNRCYHARFQLLLNVIPDGSIKILNADPPYANYRRIADGRYSGGRTASTPVRDDAALPSRQFQLPLIC